MYSWGLFRPMGVGVRDSWGWFHTIAEAVNLYGLFCPIGDGTSYCCYWLHPMRGTVSYSWGCVRPMGDGVMDSWG